MTTEILQNMLHKQSERLKSVDYIIFDEVHYINDRERGHVWEEILILLPNSIGLVMLSATVPNYLQFAQWIGSIKNTTIYIEITYKRVVPLEHKFYINTKNVILFKTADDKVHEEGIIKAVKMANEENENHGSFYSTDEKSDSNYLKDKMLYMYGKELAYKYH